MPVRSKNNASVTARSVIPNSSKEPLQYGLMPTGAKGIIAAGAATRRRMRRLVATGSQGVNAVVAGARFGVNFACVRGRSALPRHSLVERCEVCGAARKAPLGTLLRVARDG